LGDMAAADREQKLFQRFKADEASQAITSKQRIGSPEDNNERQAIHDHESVELKNLTAPSGRRMESIATGPAKPVARSLIARTHGGN
jgi:hypothetical protein